MSLHRRPLALRAPGAAGPSAHLGLGGLDREAVYGMRGVRFAKRRAPRRHGLLADAAMAGSALIKQRMMMRAIVAC